MSFVLRSLDLDKCAILRAWQVLIENYDGEDSVFIVESMCLVDSDLAAQLKDKLLHVQCPLPQKVRINKFLERHINDR